VLEERALVASGHVRDEGPTAQESAGDIQELAAGKVDVIDAAAPVQGDVSQRREVVQIGIAIARLFQPLLGLAQLLVLHLQLDLLDFEVVGELLHLLGQGCLKIAHVAAKRLLRLLAESGHGSLWIAGLPVPVTARLLRRAPPFNARCLGHLRSPRWQ
jgi:hypothetical protein